jgi:hypothetical protein
MVDKVSMLATFPITDAGTAVTYMLRTGLSHCCIAQRRHLP